jgi:hypothetical protein
MITRRLILEEPEFDIHAGLQSYLNQLELVVDRLEWRKTVCESQKSSKQEDILLTKNWIDVSTGTDQSGETFWGSHFGRSSWTRCVQLQESLDPHQTNGMS